MHEQVYFILCEALLSYGDYKRVLTDSVGFGGLEMKHLISIQHFTALYLWHGHITV